MAMRNKGKLADLYAMCMHDAFMSLLWHYTYLIYIL